MCQWKGLGSSQGSLNELLNEVPHKGEGNRTGGDGIAGANAATSEDRLICPSPACSCTITVHLVTYIRLPPFAAQGAGGIAWFSQAGGIAWFSQAGRLL